MGNVGRTDPCQMAPLPLSEFTGVQRRYDSYLFQVTPHYPQCCLHKKSVQSEGITSLKTIKEHRTRYMNFKKKKKIKKSKPMEPEPHDRKVAYSQQADSQ